MNRDPYLAGIMAKVPHQVKFKSEEKTTRCIMNCVPDIGDLVKDEDVNGLGRGKVCAVYHNKFDNYIDIEWSTNEVLDGKRTVVVKHTLLVNVEGKEN